MEAAFYKFFTQDFTIQRVVWFSKTYSSQSNKLSFGYVFLEHVTDGKIRYLDRSDNL